MPASLFLEEALLKGTLVNEAYTPTTKLWVGLSTLKVEEAGLKKSTTGKEFEEKEPKSAVGWARIEIKAETAQWEAIEKGSGASSSPTKYKNKNAVKFKTISAEEYTLLTFAVCDAATEGHILYFGTLEKSVLLNNAVTELSIPAKQLIVECE